MEPVLYIPDNLPGHQLTKLIQSIFATENPKPLDQSRSTAPFNKRRTSPDPKSLLMKNILCVPNKHAAVPEISRAQKILNRISEPPAS